MDSAVDTSDKVYITVLLTFRSLLIYKYLSLLDEMKPDWSLVDLGTSTRRKYIAKKNLFIQK